MAVKKLESVPVEALIPYARNSRTHSDEQVAQIAASIREFGFNNPVLVGADNDIIAGHGRVLAARKLGLEAVPCLRLDHLTEAQKRAYVIADNKLALNAGWDDELLKLELVSLRDDEVFDLALTGFSDSELEALLEVQTIEGETDADEVPEAKLDPVSVIGDVWELGQHRLMCGDSIMFDAVQKLMAGQTAQLIHADPPYGMGKESDGVVNDNIRGEELDRFQMDWWALWRSFTDSNGSAYIWGNAPDLWRLWYRGGLADSEHMELRNQIVWDKKSIPGMKSDLMTQYPVTTEHCLFFQLGQQFRGNINTEDFPETWEPLRSYMEGEAKAAGIGAGDIKRICGVSMYGHWFTRSQFNLIPEKYYEALAAKYTGRFTRPWRELKAEWNRVKVQEARSYFENAHDIMRDVWEFSRVSGNERHGHATPKPIEMMERVMKSSLPKGGLCIEPFGGSGSTLIAAERTGRKCFCMEITPAYVDVIVERWQKLTGKKAVHESGKTFDEMKAERQK
jgi:DNA modification methylase